MTHIEGFLAAVPAINKPAYRQHATDAVASFREFGAMRVVEAWGDNVPDGVLIGFNGLVKASGGRREERPMA